MTKLLGCILLMASGLLLVLLRAQVTLSFPEPHNLVVVSVPDKSSALQVDLLHLKLKESQLDSSAQRRRIMADDPKGWTFSAFIYPLDGNLDINGLRDREWAGLREGAVKEHFTVEQPRTYPRGEIAMLEYMISEFRGQRVDQKNVFGYMASGGLGLDFHISKIGYKAEDQKFIDSFLDGVKLLENYQPDSRTEFGYGSLFYLRQDWVRASTHYEHALELEKHKRMLSAAEWRVVVDNLGMSYGISGDLPKAKEVFESAVREDPTYPLFRYNLACADAETDHFDEALEQLKIAFQDRANGNPGEGMPDPAKDDSFKRYLNDPRFRELSKQVCPTSRRSESGWICIQ